ncbi:carboxypeptidase regulatory-like domain-containing protein, partial [candidate division WOR-3 bacterium]|nr:carboxypeptidase regulatory-like domain-containing protein [candidate division WOR-3 bacterium]
GLSYHTYGEIVNYLWNWTPTRTQDDSLIVILSNGYASYNGYWVTEGFDWYRTNGDMNDYSYGIDGTIDWTIELATSFIPPPLALDGIWDENRPAILYLIRKCIQGISGVVRDASTGDTLRQAVVNIDEIDWPVFCDPASGHFHRILRPGTYTVTAWANGYYPKTVSNVMVNADTSTGIIIDLNPGGGSFAYKYAVANIPDMLSNPIHNVTLTPWALGPVDSKFTSIGKGGEVILDMGSLTPIVDGTGDDFTVYEGDDGIPDEGYAVYVSNSYRGPWTFLASGTGTQSFDIVSFGSSARYVRIMDDDDGSLTEPTPGFDLEAIESAEITGVYIIVENYYTDDSSTGNNNGIFDPGESVYLIVSLHNGGSVDAINMIGELSSSDPYVDIDSSISHFGNINAGTSENNSLDPFLITSLSSTQQGYIASLTLVVNEDGGYVDTFFLNVKVGAGGDFLIWDNDPNQSSGSLIQSALELVGYNGIRTTNLSSYYDELQYYLAVFVCCGIYPNNTVIHDGGSDATALVNYVNSGGRMYLEGGD